MMDYDETVCLCALNKIFGFVPQKGRRLYEYAGSAAAVFGMDPEERRQCLGSHAPLSDKICPAAQEEAEEELRRLAHTDCRFVSLADEAYPPLLRECDDPPLGLYVRSATDPAALFVKRPAIAVVGTRKITPYGAEWCRRIVRGLSEAAVKPVIVSGLAFGTDIIAHKTALENGLPTFGVMATGIDVIYPRQHRETAERLAALPGGALLTDYPLDSQPEPLAFIRRNRIIAGLSKAVILIESRLKGGGLITARFANDYNRDLFALPGRIDDECSQGCNLLIRDNRAEPVTDLADLVGKLNLGTVLHRQGKDLRDEALRRFAPLLPPEKARAVTDLLMLVRQYRGITLDQLCRKAGKPYPAVSEEARLLENEGFISIDLLQRCALNAKKV